MITCPNGLVYNEKAGICSWPDEAKRAGCTSEGKLYSYFISPFQVPKIALEFIRANRITDVNSPSPIQTFKDKESVLGIYSRFLVCLLFSNLKIKINRPH